MSGPAVCRYFLSKGFCYRGDKCKFAHPESSGGGGGGGGAAPAAGGASSTRGGAPGALGQHVGGHAAPSGSSMGPSIPQGGGGVPGQGSSLKDELAAKNAHRLARVQPEDPRYHELPPDLDNGAYHSFYPLRDYDKGSVRPVPTVSSQIPFKSEVFKVVSTADGRACALRRFVSCRVVDVEQANATIAAFQRLAAGKVGHSAVVTPQRVFSTQEFNDGGSLCFVYDYYPCAVTLEEYAFGGAQAKGLTSEQMWSLICQMLSALSAIHRAGLYCGSLDASRVLMTSPTTFKLSWCGVLHSFQVLQQVPIQELQYRDLVDLGTLVLNLACQSPTATRSNLGASLDYVAHQYSDELKSLCQLLLLKNLAAGSTLPTVFRVCALLSHRLVAEMENAHSRADRFYDELSREAENGRLVGLVAKLNFVLNRPERAQFSESQDIYLLKLFNDFVFHQVDEAGRPDINFGHAVYHLNMLDVGSSEKTLLTSRKEDSMLIVSYAELRQALERAFQELRGGADQAAAQAAIAMARARQNQAAPVAHVMPEELSGYAAPSGY